jgi:hypothetical protein
VQSGRLGYFKLVAAGQQQPVAALVWAPLGGKGQRRQHLFGLD